MAIAEQTVETIILELARSLGDAVVSGTATAGGAATIIDTVNAAFADDDALNGAWVAVTGGTNVGDIRQISDYAASSKTITAVSNFSATTQTSTRYIVTRKWSPQQYIDAVAAAVRACMKTSLVPLDDLTGSLDRLITLGDILSTDGNGNGQMEEWSAGTSAAPDGWTKDGNTTIARESGTNNVRRGTYSAKMTSNGSALAQLTQDIKHYDRFSEKTLRLEAWVMSNTASRALIRLGDGVSTVTATYGTTANVWEELSAELDISNVSTNVQADLEISAGGAVIAYWDDVRLISDGTALYQYDLPSRMVYLSAVQEELGSGTLGTTDEEAYHPPIPSRAYSVERGANPKLIFDKQYIVPSKDQHVRLSGQAHPALITSSTPATAYTETVEANPEFIKSYARWYLLNSVGPDEMTDQTRLMVRSAREDWMQQLEALGNRALPNSKPVQVL